MYKDTRVLPLLGVSEARAPSLALAIFQPGAPSSGRTQKKRRGRQGDPPLARAARTAQRPARAANMVVEEREGREGGRAFVSVLLVPSDDSKSIRRVSFNRSYWNCQTLCTFLQTLEAWGRGNGFFENLINWHAGKGVITGYALPRGRCVAGFVTGARGTDLGARGTDLLLVRGGGTANRFVTVCALRGAQICSRRHVPD